jgi:hypothetical protein
VRNISESRRAELYKLIDEIVDMMVKGGHVKRDDPVSLIVEMRRDFEDELSAETIAHMITGDNPWEKFHDIVMEFEGNYAGYYKLEVYRALDACTDKCADTMGIELTYEERDAVFGHIAGCLVFQLDEDIGDDIVSVNIIMDIEDMNHDFTTTIAGAHYAETDYMPEPYELNEEAAWVWLAQQQGYTNKQIISAVWGGEFGGSKFLESLHNEFANCSSQMNALTFFVRMTVNDMISIEEARRVAEKSSRYYGNLRQDVGTVTVTKETPCGFVDYWNGAGSILEIKLEKDVEIPIKYLDSAWIDGARGYSVMDIYGVCGEFYHEMLKSIDIK